MPGGWVLALVVLAAVAGIGVLARGAAGSSDFEIRLGPGDRVEVRGRLPGSKVPAIRGFFRDLPGGVPRGRIRGRFGPSGAPRLAFVGRFDPRVRQRTRNFLINHLR